MHILNRIPAIMAGIALIVTAPESVADEALNPEPIDSGAVFVCKDQQDWTRRSAIQSYFRSHYYTIDLRNGAFLSKDDQYTRFSSMPMGKEKARLAHQYHERASGMIMRLGLLFPHFTNPADRSETIRQIESGLMEHNPGDSNVQFLRFALTQVMLESSIDAKETMLGYIKVLQTLEALTAKLQTEEPDTDQAAELDQLTRIAWQSHKRFRDIAKPVILSPELHDQMSTKLVSRCKTTGAELVGRSNELVGSE